MNILHRHLHVYFSDESTVTCIFLKQKASCNKSIGVSFSEVCIYSLMCMIVKE